MTIIVEFSPVKRGCSQGCAVCPEARRDTTKLATSIDTEALASFKIFEELVARKNLQYGFYPNFPVFEGWHLFPEIRNPELVCDVGFDLGPVHPTADSNEVVTMFTKTIEQNLYEKIGHIPNSGRFTFVPEHLVLGEKEKEIMSLMTKQFSRIFLQDAQKPGALQVRAHSNYVLAEDLSRSASAIRDADNYVFGDIGSNVLSSPYQGSQERLKYSNTMEKIIDAGYMYFYGLSHQDDVGHEYFLAHRIMAYLQSSVSMQKEFERAVYSKTTAKGVSLLITPRGVMLNHISLFINNRPHWFSHSDFRRIIQECFRKKSAQSIYNHLQKAMEENILTFGCYMDLLQGGDEVMTFQDCLDVFEENRDIVREGLRENAQLKADYI